MPTLYYETELSHHGVKGQKWGVRRYQNPDGTLTTAGKKRNARLNAWGETKLRMTSKLKDRAEYKFGKKSTQYKKLSKDEQKYKKRMKELQKGVDDKYLKGGKAGLIGRTFVTHLFAGPLGDGVYLYSVNKAFDNKK